MAAGTVRGEDERENELVDETKGARGERGGTEPTRRGRMFVPRGWFRGIRGKERDDEEVSGGGWRRGSRGRLSGMENCREGEGEGGRESRGVG